MIADINFFLVSFGALPNLLSKRGPFLPMPELYSLTKTDVTNDIVSSNFASADFRKIKTYNF